MAVEGTSSDTTSNSAAPKNLVSSIVEGSYEWLLKTAFKEEIDLSAISLLTSPVGIPREGAQDSSSVETTSPTNETIQTDSSIGEEVTSQTSNSEAEKVNTEASVDEAKKNAAKLLLRETNIRLAFKAHLRQKNNNSALNRPDEQYFAKLDSNLKRNSAFVRKLRNFTTPQLEGLVRDMSALNLSKYLSEAAAALVEAKLKVTDVGAAVVMCSLIHQTYAEFAPALLDNWHKVLTLKKDEKIANPSKLRVDLRLFGDLVSVGLFPQREALTLLGQIISALINADKEEHLNAAIILSFCKHCGEDYAGLVPSSLREAAELLGVEIPRSSLLIPDKQKGVRSLLSDYYSSLCKHLLKEHKELSDVERQNRRILQTKGELSTERKEKLDMLQHQYNKLFNSVQAFSDTLDQPLPELPVERRSEEETGLCISGIIGITENDDNFPSSAGLVGGLWEDEETQHFYEDFPNLRDYLPVSKPRDKELSSSPSPTPVPQVTEEVLDAELREEDLVQGNLEEPSIVEEEPEESEVNCPTALSSKQQLEQFLNCLPNCVNRELIDNAAAEFLVSLNAKHNKRKLVRVLFGVPRTRLDLLPFYARLVAALHPVLPEVAQDLCTMLKQDFMYHVSKKDQINIESKIKVVRFIGELVKFKMYQLIEGLYCLKLLLHDFTHHHIEMACALLETCGRYFLRRSESHQRTKIYLEQMMRQKTALSLDARYVTMIENAYFFVNPPEGASTKIKERPPMHSFIRKILYQDLSKPTTDKVFRLMRRLKWDDKELASYAIKCLTGAWNVKYYNIRCLASLVAGLIIHQESVGPMVVDGVLEDIRVCMEINLPKLNQRRVAMVKYLGELYNYRVVENGDVFRVLYSLIKFGVSTDNSNPSPLDSPDNLFRIRLVCTLLGTCGQFFNSGPSRQRLDYFIIYFQHYYWMKRESGAWITGETVNSLTGGGDGPAAFPNSVKYLFQDTLLGLRPNLTLVNSLEEAVAAVEQLETTLLSQLPKITTSKGDSSELGTITEDSERETDAEKDDQSHAESSMEDTEEDNEADTAEDEDEFDNLMEEDEEDEEDAEGTAGDSEVQDDCNSVKIKRKETEVECLEDKDFLDEFERMVSDNIQDHARAGNKSQQVDIAIPLHVRTSQKKTYEQLQTANENGDTEPNTMNFVLLTRRGNKQAYRNLCVPLSSELALNLRCQEQEERREMEKVKRLTLDINERLEEEDYQDMMAATQRPTTANLNRERRSRYQHPKGVPDADLIFGPKRVR